MYHLSSAKSTTLCNKYCVIHSKNSTIVNKTFSEIFLAVKNLIQMVHGASINHSKHQMLASMMSQLLFALVFTYTCWPTLHLRFEYLCKQMLSTHSIKVICIAAIRGGSVITKIHQQKYRAGLFVEMIKIYLYQ